MKNRIKDIIKDPRIIAIIAFYIIGLFSFITLKAGGNSKGISIYDITKDPNIYSVKLFLFIPIVLIACIILLGKRVSYIPFYSIGSILQLFLTVFICLKGGERIGSYSQVEGELPKVVPHVGFFLILLIWLFVLAWTIIKDIAPNMNKIKENGIKSILFNTSNKNDKEDIGFDMNDIKSKVSNVISDLKEDGITCPSCGKIISKKDSFCTFCGYKNDDDVDTIQYNERITVAEYIKRKKYFKCTNCGETVLYSDKFCPECGEKVEYTVRPRKCTKCNTELTEDCAYCPNCAEKIVSQKLEIKCKQCGEDLIYGKDYCVNCGAKQHN